MTPAPPAPDDPRLQTGVQLLSDLRSEIARADAKAAVLVGVLGMATGALGVLLTSRNWSPGRLPAPAALLWWTGVASLVTSLFALLLAVTPRYGMSRWRPGRPLTYFGDIREAARAGRLATALTETWRDPGRGLLLALAETSDIAARKNFWIRAGLIAFGTAAVLLPCSLLVG
ncbi:Pycsar system effector family protein [Streptomyces sp. NPDC086519]|uniref:Pycsar system effector family protein n=1 Tax=Streptomyces sp. NPDC086519 TaxID=3154863 RepID=UPI0034250B5B